MQPIVGVALDVKGEGGVEGTLALFAQNTAGYANLMRLSSAAFLDVGAHEDAARAVRARARGTLKA